MAVTIEPLVTVSGANHAWICRSGPEHLALGDPYVTVCTVSRLGGGMALITALAGPELKKAEVEALKSLLRREQFTSVSWKRIRPDGAEHWAVISLAQ